MCGRYTLAADPASLTRTIPGLEVPQDMHPRYNIAPSQDVAVVANDGTNQLHFFRWGLVPSWAKDPKIGYRMINARSETLAEKPSFRTAYRRRRCLVLADGFYEWYQPPDSDGKTPVYVQLASEEPFAFAGLWEAWHPPDAEESLLSCTIITTTPNELMQKFHHRMPVILDPEDYSIWLDPEEQTPELLNPLLRPYPAEEMRAYPVSRFVNQPRNDSPECIHPAEGAFEA